MKNPRWNNHCGNNTTVPLLLYDGACSLCRNLAFYAKKLASNIEIQPWQEFIETPRAQQCLDQQLLQEKQPLELRVLVGSQLYSGEKAWAWLLKHYPGLSAMGWLAERLGLVEVTARLMQRGSHAVRRRCSWCRPW